VGQAFNLAHPPVTQRAFVEALGRAAGVTPALVSAPRKAILAEGGNAFAGDLYFGEYLDLPPMTEAVGKVTRVLGLSPGDFEEGLRRSREWYLAGPRRPVDYAFEDRVLSRLGR
jgi:nucleoside-diphosphate-sugar epimerase